MPQRDLGAVLDDDGLDYPGIASKAHPEGKTYRVPAPNVPDGLLYARLFEKGIQAANGVDISEEDAKRLQLDGDDETAFLRKILGSDTFDEMLADDVSWPMVQKIAQDAFLCWAADEAVADLVLAARGKAPAPNRAARRAAAKKAPGKKATAKKTAGSKSSPASTDTPARTTAPASTPSSKSTPTTAAKKAG